jgi:transposase, IS5 family
MHTGMVRAGCCSGAGYSSAIGMVDSRSTWHFGMKAHISVHADSGRVHTVVATSAEVSDVTQADRLLHGEESDALGRARERLKQAKVEHPFQVIKQRFGHRKVRYRGLAKNTAQLCTLFGLANLVLARRRLLETCA